MTKASLLLCSVALLSSVGESAEPAERVAVPAPESLPLREVGKATINTGDYMAWGGRVLCDEDQATYFLFVPPVPKGSKIAPGLRAILRVSADGKGRTTFDPLVNPKFAQADQVSTRAIALDSSGALFALVWATWKDASEEGHKGAQYIVSFGTKGESRSSVEIDGREILVEEFEVFGSGDFLLRGRRTHTEESRLMILSSSGQSMVDVPGWFNETIEEPRVGFSEGPERWHYMARGGDGRIYATQQDPGRDPDVVFAISASGPVERLFELPLPPKNSTLTSWQVVGDHFATTYKSGSSSGDGSRNWWVAVHTAAPGASALETTVYGPVPGVPICYQRGLSKDQFTFLQDGATLVTMSSR